MSCVHLVDDLHFQHIVVYGGTQIAKLVLFEPLELSQLEALLDFVALLAQRVDLGFQLAVTCDNFRGGPQRAQDESTTP